MNKTRLLLISISVFAFFVTAVNAQKFLGNIIQGSAPSNFSQFWNQVTPDNAGKWGSVEGSRDNMNWGSLDVAYNYAKQQGYVFKEHTFVWGAQEPGWIGSLSQNDQRAEVEEWIRLYGQRYPNTDYIDVVNEPLHQPASYRNALGGSGSTGWDWVVTAFQMARQYCPNAKLLINEYGIISDPNAANQYVTIINILKNRGLIDGIGIQCHSFNMDNVSTSTMTQVLNNLGNTGLPIYVSELDMTGSDSQQLQRYQQKFPIFWNHSSVKGITLWGYIQGTMWESAAWLVSSSGTQRPAMQWLMSNYGPGSNNCNPTAITPYIQVNGGSWQQTSAVTVTSGSTVVLGPQPVSGGSWSWSGCGTSGTSREQTITPTSSCTATATYTNSCGAQSTQNFNITVSGSSGGTSIWLEAECGTVGSLWNIVSDGNASHDQYVTIQSGNNSTGSAPGSSNGYITYPFSVSGSGSYTLWARVIAPSPNDDSFWVRMDNGSWFSWNNITASSAWTWDDCQSYSLSAGSHTLTIAYSEDGTRLDKNLITNTGTTPSGEGSAAGNCGSSGGDYSITVRARGTAGSEQIRLTVGGTAIQTWTLSTSLSNYTATTSNSGAINVEFINDDGTNRDVQVDYIQVPGATLQAENQATNTGVWQNSQCGGSNSEWLHCAGYIGFSAYKSSEIDIEPVTGITGVNIYPNPASDQVNIELPGLAENHVTIGIYTMAGVLVRSVEVSDLNTGIDISDMHTGYYIIKITRDQSCYSGRFFKQ